MEEIVRAHLNVKDMASKEGCPVIDRVISSCIKDESLLSMWEMIADRIPRRWEKYSLELLSAIIRLWFHIRIHAFAKCWTMNFTPRYQKGTRKGLKVSSK